MAIAVALLIGFVAAEGPAQAAGAAVRERPDRHAARHAVHKPAKAAHKTTPAKHDTHRKKAEHNAPKLKAGPSPSASRTARAEDNNPTTILSAAFNPTTIYSGENTDLTFTLSWDDGSGANTGVAFTAALPSGLKTVGSGSSWYDNQCGGTVTKPVAGSVRLSGATVPASSSCTLTIHMTGFTVNGYSVTDSEITDKSADISGPVGAELGILGGLHLVTSFDDPTSVKVGENGALKFTLYNPGVLEPVYSFVATLPAHLATAAGSATNTCGGSVATTPGGSTVTTSGMQAAPLSFSGCSITVPVVADTPGAYSTADIAMGSVVGLPANQSDTLRCVMPLERDPSCPPTPHTLTVTAPQLPQTISFPPPADTTVAAGTVTLEATATSALPVTYSSSTPAVCTVSGSTATLKAPGTCTITALQGGNANFATAIPVEVSFAVATPTAQTITFKAPADTPLTAGTAALSATASSQLPVTFTGGSPAVCTVSGTTATLVTTGTCSVTATQAGDETFGPADPVTVSFAVTEAAKPPSSVVASAGTSSITATWTAPADTTGVTGYTAVATPGPATCSTSAATMTTCIMGGSAGVTYTVTVVAHSSGGDSAPAGPSNAVTVAAPTPPPSGPPPTDLTLTTDQGLITTAEPGQDIVFIGTGFAPHSTVVITIYSTPTVLGTVITDGNGDFSKPITIPPGLVIGGHTATAQGVAPDGSPRAMNLAITVQRVAATRGGAMLPTTGAAVTVMLLTGLASTSAGAGLLFAARPRRRREA